MARADESDGCTSARTQTDADEGSCKLTAEETESDGNSTSSCDCDWAHDESSVNCHGPLPTECATTTHTADNAGVRSQNGAESQLQTAYCEPSPQPCTRLVVPLVQRVHTLREMCIGFLGPYVEQVASMEGLLLPPDVKAILVAIARCMRC